MRFLPALGAALLFLAAPAAAAPPPRLERLLAEGEALTRAADGTCSTPLVDALLSAERSDDTYVRAAGALGLCREVQGKWADAHQLVSRALEGAPAETTPAGKAARWVALRAALQRLDNRVARALVTWEDGAELYVDGRPAGGPSGRVLAVDPGRRLFEARRGGKTIAAEEREARAGDLPVVHLRTVKTTAAPSQATVNSAPISGSQTAATSPFAPALTPRGVAVGITYGAGAVALVSGVVAGVLEAQRSALAASLPKDACTGPAQPERCAELRLAFDQRTGARNVALVASGLALAAGGTAIALHFTVDKVAPASAGLMVSRSW